MRLVKWREIRLAACSATRCHTKKKRVIERARRGPVTAGAGKKKYVELLELTTQKAEARVNLGGDSMGASLGGCGEADSLLLRK